MISIHHDIEQQHKIINEARLFAEAEIRPFSRDFEEQSGIPQSLITMMAERGYLGARLSPEFGGLGLNAVQYGILTGVIGQACASVRSLMTVHTSLVGETLSRWGSSYQKERFLPQIATGKQIACFALSEPGAGSDAGGIVTTYCKRDEAYVIRGAKKWITMGCIADLFLVIANGQAGISAFIVEKEFKGITILPMRGLMAGRSAHIAEVIFDSVEVPADNMVGREGSGFTCIVNSALDAGRYSVAWGGLGIAQEALECMVSYSSKRRQFGQKIGSFQLIRAMIANATTNVHAGRSLCIRAGELRDAFHDDAFIETTIAKHFTSLIANQVAADAVQVHGGNGISSQYPAERLFREAKVLEIIEGSTQIQKEIISQFAQARYRSKRNATVPASMQHDPLKNNII